MKFLLMFLSTVLTGCLALSTESLPETTEKSSVFKLNGYIDVNPTFLNGIASIARQIEQNGTKQLVSNENFLKINVFIATLNYTIQELIDYQKLENTIRFNETEWMEMERYGLKMYKNTMINMDYIINKAVEIIDCYRKLYQLEEYLSYELQHVLKYNADFDFISRVIDVRDSIKKQYTQFDQYAERLMEIVNILKEHRERMASVLKIENQTALIELLKKVSYVYDNTGMDEKDIILY